MNKAELDQLFGKTANEQADEETEALRALSEIPTHIWFPGKQLKAARAPFETCWKQAPLADDESGTMTFVDYNGNQYCTVTGYNEPNEHGSIVLPIGDSVLVVDPTTKAWGAGETLESANLDMNEDAEALPYICEVYTSSAPMFVSKTGEVKTRNGSPVTKLFSKRGNLVYPNGA
jgi:hypothetical protein